MNYADEIKSRLTAREVFEFYGFSVNRSGFCLSPFSGEKTPSCKIYDGQRGWHDFSSNNGGDIIDFVRLYFGLPFPAACEKLNVDFQLGLPIGKQHSRQEQIEAKRKAEERKKAIADRKKRAESLTKAYDDALTEWIRLDTIKRECAPESPETPFSAAFAYALRNIDGAAYRLAEAEANLYEFRQKQKEENYA